MITRIEIDSATEDVTFYLDDGSDPYSSLEFTGETSDFLLNIGDAIYNFNHLLDGSDE